MRSRDYECWIEALTSSDEDSPRLEEKPVPLVRKLSDTSRHARTSVVLAPGQKYALKWRRIAIYGITEGESQDPFVTCVWVIIALNGRTLGEGLLSDLNNQTKSSLDRISSSTALTGTPLWEERDGVPSGLMGKLTISFYRSPEVIRRALKDRAYSEPERAAHPDGNGHGGRSASIVRRNPLLFRGAGNPPPTIFNFFFEVIDPEKTPKAASRPLRNSVSMNFEQVLKWSRRKSWRGTRECSEDSTAPSIYSDAPVTSNGIGMGFELEKTKGKAREMLYPPLSPVVQQVSTRPRAHTLKASNGRLLVVPLTSEGVHPARPSTIDTDVTTTVLPVPIPSPPSSPVVQKEPGRARAQTLRAINGRLVVVPASGRGSRGFGSSTVDTDYQLNARPRAATIQTPIVPSQRPSGATTSADTFLSAVTAFQGEPGFATRPRRALSDATDHHPARDMSEEITKQQTLRRGLVARHDTSPEVAVQDQVQDTFVAENILGRVSEDVQREGNDLPSSEVNQLNPWSINLASHHQLTPVVETDRESVRNLAVAYRDSLHESITEGPLGQQRTLPIDHGVGSNVLSGSTDDNGLTPPNRKSSLHHLKGITPEVAKTGFNGNRLARGALEDDVNTSEATVAALSEHDTQEETVPSSTTSTLPPDEVNGDHEEDEDEDPPATPTAAQLQMYEAKRALIVPLEDTLRALKEEEETLLHVLELRRLDEYQSSLSKQVERRRRRVSILEDRLKFNVRNVERTLHSLGPGMNDGDSVGCVGGAASPTRSITTSLASGREFGPATLMQTSKAKYPPFDSHAGPPDIIQRQQQQQQQRDDRDGLSSFSRSAAVTPPTSSSAPLSEAALARHSSQPGNDSLIAARRQLASLAAASAAGTTRASDRTDSHSILSEAGSKAPTPLHSIVAPARRGGGVKTLHRNAPNGTLEPPVPESSGTSERLSASSLPRRSVSSHGWEDSPTLGLTPSSEVPTLKPSDFSLSSNSGLVASSSSTTTTTTTDNNNLELQECQ